MVSKLGTILFFFEHPSAKCNHVRYEPSIGTEIKDSLHTHVTIETEEKQVRHLSDNEKRHHRMPSLLHK
jgi:hypothetical protein